MFGKKKKKTLIERLTGAIHLDEDDDFDFEEETPRTRGSIHHPVYAEQYPQEAYPIQEQTTHSKNIHLSRSPSHHTFDDAPTEDIGELSVDVINSADTIVVKAMIAGVKPSDIDVDITRDSITLRATRSDEHEIEEENFHMRELYWGTFARTIALPEEVDVDLAEAKEKHGLLVITLPKLDKHRKAKLQIKSN